ncbi:MAG TPA: hydrogenase maturation protease [Euryarchaeota archaeon]|nr:hydrogenase maturation protease [Euryarchaeota archaeon]
MRHFSNLKELLSGATRIVVVGVGYDLGKDDAVGIEVADLLEGKHPAITPFKTYTAPENFTKAIVGESPSHVVFVDGAKMGLEPGEIRIIENDEIKDTSFSTHTMPLTLISKYVCNRAKAKSVIIGIEPKHFGFCEDRQLSNEVTVAAKTVADAILAVFNDV